MSSSLNCTFMCLISQLQQRVSDVHANIRQQTSTDAKLQYIRAWQALLEHGMHYFIVRFAGNRKRDLLGVAHNRLIKMNPTTARISRLCVKKWHVSAEKSGT